MIDGLHTKKELADLLGLSVRQIDNLLVEGIPRVRRGRRVLYGADAVAWYFRRKLDAAEAERPADLNKERAALVRVQRQLAEMELAEKEGRLVPLAYMQQQLEAICERLRAKLTVFPGKVAPLSIGLRSYAEALAMLKTAIAEAMASLSETGEDPELDAVPAGRSERASPARVAKRARKRAAPRPRAPS